MIKIGVPWIEKFNGRSRCNCAIHVDDEKRIVWFEVDEEYGEYLCCERADAYVIGLLNWAMRENHEIQCDIPITDELLYNINVILIPSLVNYSQNLHAIKIVAEVAPVLKQGEAIGTGCSCGIDSFSAIYNHINTVYKGLDLTHLCINNVGAFNECYAEYGAEKVKEERYDITDIVASEIGLPLLKTDSNFAQEFKQEHLLTHTYSSVFAVYMLQKLWKIYYYASSGYDYNYFSLRDNDSHPSAYYELLSLQCFSISSLRIYSEGGEKSRLRKTIDIVDYDIARKYLHVCLRKSVNCGECSKCMRTLTTLDYLGKLEEFSQVFNIDNYKFNKRKYYKWLFRQHCDKDIMNEPVYQGLSLRKEFKRAVFFEKVIWPLRLVRRKIRKYIIKL